MLEYTVVATTFNDSKEIKEYLNSICNQTFPPKEIIIADGGSSDDTILVCTEFDAGEKTKIIVLNDGRLNISQGYNLAIRNTATEYVGVTGVGNFYEPDYFEKLLKYVPEYEVVYSPVRGYDVNKYSETYNRTFLNGDYGQRISIATNHGVLLRKSIFDKLGYFYEEFIYAGEDAEFYQMVKDAGYSTLIVPDAKCLWFTPKNRKEFLKQIKNYAIADMQIYGFRKIIKREKRNILKLMIDSIGLLGILLTLFSNYLWTLFFVGAFATVHIVDAYKYRGKNYKMVIEQRYYKLYYYFRFRKYFGKEYLVHRRTAK